MSRRRSSETLEELISELENLHVSEPKYVEKASDPEIDELVENIERLDLNSVVLVPKNDEHRTVPQERIVSTFDDDFDALLDTFNKLNLQDIIPPKKNLLQLRRMSKELVKEVFQETVVKMETAQKIVANELQLVEVLPKAIAENQIYEMRTGTVSKEIPEPQEIQLSQSLPLGVGARHVSRIKYRTAETQPVTPGVHMSRLLPSATGRQHALEQYEGTAERMIPQEVQLYETLPEATGTKHVSRIKPRTAEMIIPQEVQLYETLPEATGTKRVSRIKPRTAEMTMPQEVQLYEMLPEATGTKRVSRMKPRTAETMIPQEVQLSNLLPAVTTQSNEISYPIQSGHYLQPDQPISLQRSSAERVGLIETQPYNQLTALRDDPKIHFTEQHYPTARGTTYEMGTPSYSVMEEEPQQPVRLAEINPVATGTRFKKRVKGRTPQLLEAQQPLLLNESLPSTTAQKLYLNDNITPGVADTVSHKEIKLVEIPTPAQVKLEVPAQAIAEIAPSIVPTVPGKLWEEPVERITKEKKPAKVGLFSLFTAFLAISAGVSFGLNGFAGSNTTNALASTSLNSTAVSYSMPPVMTSSLSSTGATNVTRPFSTSLSTIPMYSSDLATVPIYSSDVATIPVYSSDVATIPTWSTDLSTVPTYSKDLSTVPTYSKELSTVPTFSNVPISFYNVDPLQSQLSIDKGLSTNALGKPYTSQNQRTLLESVPLGQVLTNQAILTLPLDQSITAVMPAINAKEIPMLKTLNQEIIKPVLDKMSETPFSSPEAKPLFDKVTNSEYPDDIYPIVSVLAATGAIVFLLKKRKGTTILCHLPSKDDQFLAEVVSMDEKGELVIAPIGNSVESEQCKIWLERLSKASSEKQESIPVQPTLAPPVQFTIPQFDYTLEDGGISGTRKGRSGIRSYDRDKYVKVTFKGRKRR